jgi:prepilin-type N-terminal cleavage/methylation domain-containing protein
MRKIFPSKTTAGFTLIETLITVFVSSMLAVGVIALVSSILTSSGKQGTLLYSADQARRVSFQIKQELRNAYTSSVGSYAITTANAQELIFYTDTDGDVGMERVRYFIQNGSLRRGVVDPSGNPLAYNFGSEVVRDIQGGVANQANPLFYYYDDTYDGTAENFLAQPVDVTDIRYIKLNLMVYNRGGNAGTGIFTVTAGSTIRNLKTNL